MTLREAHSRGLPKQKGGILLVGRGLACYGTGRGRFGYVLLWGMSFEVLSTELHSGRGTAKKHETRLFGLSARPWHRLNVAKWRNPSNTTVNFGYLQPFEGPRPQVLGPSRLAWPWSGLSRWGHPGGRSLGRLQPTKGQGASW